MRPVTWPRPSRELHRNAARLCGRLQSKATTAQRHADLAAQRPKAAKLASTPALRLCTESVVVVIATPSGRRVAGPSVEWNGRKDGRRQHLRWGRAWRPAQIANRLVLNFSNDPTMRISADAIYQALYVITNWSVAPGMDRSRAHRAGAPCPPHADGALA